MLPRLAYISFDTVPAPKGASTHIAAFTRALARAFGSVELVTVSATTACETRIERWPGVFHTELPGLGVSLIDRVLCFRRCLDRWLATRQFDLVQFRSIFEGIPLLRLQPRPRLIFEVNGLPSIELKHRYPRAADDRELMGKLFAQERACLEAADRIVTPSSVTARYLALTRAVDASKIRVIPNGVDPNLFRPNPFVVAQALLPSATAFSCGADPLVRSRRPRRPSRIGQNVDSIARQSATDADPSPTPEPSTRSVAQALVPAAPRLISALAGLQSRSSPISLLYFGTLHQWQGVEIAVRAVAQICSQTPAKLTILGAATTRQRDPILALAAKLGIASQIEIAPPVEQPELVQALHRSFAVLAPLGINDRNTLQGCCPLKILEGMAAGIPVIASDLPVVRELADHGKHCLLVKPGSVDQIAQAVLQLRADPDLWRLLSEGGRRQVIDRYTWERSGTALVAVCAELGISPASNS